MGEIAVKPISNVFKKYKSVIYVNPYLASAPVVNLANTIIGGVASLIYTPALLAQKIFAGINGGNLSVNDIKSFAIIGNDIEFSVEKDFYIGGFSTDVFPAIVTKLIHTGVFLKGINTLGLTNQVNITVLDIPSTVVLGSQSLQGLRIRTYNLPNCTSLLGQFHFNFGGDTDIVYIPKCINFGANTVNSGIFGNQIAEAKIYVHPSMLTVNRGNLEGDLQQAQSSGATIVSVTNFTKPNPVTNLSTGLIKSTEIQLNFTEPSSANAIDFYEVYVNGILNNRIKGSGGLAINLKMSTLHNIEIYAVDIFYNKSLVSNLLTLSTGTFALERLHQKNWFNVNDVKFYLKLDGSTVDYNNAFNGVGTNITFSSNESFPFLMADFNGVSSKITLPDTATYNDSQTVVFWAKTNNKRGSFYGKGSDASGGWGLNLRHDLSNAAASVVTLSPTVGWGHSVTDTKSTGQVFHFAFTYDNTVDKISIYINGTKIGEKSQAGNLLRGNTNVLLGVLRNSSSFSNFLNGSISDFAVIKRVLSDSEIMSLQMA